MSSNNSKDEALKSDLGSNSSADGSSYASFLRFLGCPGETLNPSHSTPSNSTMMPGKTTSAVPTSVTVDAAESKVAFAIPSDDDELESGLVSANNQEDGVDDFLKAAFAQADADSNGQISIEELKTLLRRLGLGMSDNDLDKWMQQIDVDDSGEVSFEEFVSIFKREKENNTLQRILRETFETYDADGSGRIDCVELRLLLAQLGHDISDGMAKDMIRQVDQDGNGEIDFKEFVSMFKGVKIDDMNEVVRSADKISSSAKYGRQTSMNSILEESISIFDDAKELISIGKMFRCAMYVHSNRVLVLLAAVHFVATIIIWAHFALIKLHELDIPGETSYHWLKKTFPPLLFGSKHAINFQMALIPFTMARYSISSLSGNKLNRYIPLNKAMRAHIYLGYTMVLIVILASAAFFVLYGLPCGAGDVSFCDKFTTEIMITGYCILGLVLFMAGAAFYRHTIPYEVFYAVHALFLVMYSLVVVHTIDAVERSGKRERYQNYVWFVVPLLFYFCDYAMMYINQRFKTKVSEFTAVEGHDGSKMVILKMERPTLFMFEPGQYAFLRCQSIDRTWHPFTIASAPNSNTVEFYIEVFDGGWTEKLWNTLKNNSRRGFTIDLMGPYGTGLVREPVYTNIIAVGVGTGIVPCISLLKQHVKTMLMMEPEAFLASIKEKEAENMEVRHAEQTQEGSLIKHLVSRCKHNDVTPALDISRRQSLIQQQDIHAMMAQAATSVGNSKTSALLRLEVVKATKNMYRTVTNAVFTLYAVTIFGLTISWTTIPVDLSNHSITGLELSIAILHGIFLLCSFFIWAGASLQAYVDAVVAVICPFADWRFLTAYTLEGGLDIRNIILLSILNGYIAIRMYQKTLAPDKHHSSNETMRHLQFIWSVRTAKIARQILPEIEETYNRLVQEWGPENTQKVLSISIHITEKNRDEAATFRAEIRNSLLFKNKQVFCIRPKLDEVLEDHQTVLIDNFEYSNSLVAFCGGPQLSRVLREKKTKLELLSAALGYSNHTLDFASESYGGPKSGKQTTFGKSARSVEHTPVSLWDLVKQETTTVVNSQRIKQVFSDENRSNRPIRRSSLLMRTQDFTSRREMLEFHRSTGTSLRFRSKRVLMK